MAEAEDKPPVPNESGEAEAAPCEPPTSVLSQAIVTLQEDKAADRDRLLRLAAEFDNYKKRTKRSTDETRRQAEERVVLDFLPVADNLERALAHAEGDAQGLADGVRMVHKQLATMLERYEIHGFDAVGQPFDPQLHEAIQQMPCDLPAGTVCQELQRGYRRGERLVRPALVVVSTGKAQGAADEASESGQAEKQ